MFINPHIVDHEGKSLKLIHRSLEGKWWNVIVLCGTSTDERSLLRNAETLDEVYAIAPVVADWALEEIETKFEEKQEVRQTRLRQRMSMAAEYLPAGVLVHRETKAKGSLDLIRRWKGDVSYQNAGLLARIEQLEAETVLPEPVALAVQNQLPPNPELGLQHDLINPQYWEAMRKLGLIVSGEKILWRENTRAWNTIVKCFPKAIEARGYIHGLNAPLIPGGFLPNTDIEFRNLTTLKPICPITIPTKERVIESVIQFREMGEDNFAREFLAGLRYSTWEKRDIPKYFAYDKDGELRGCEELTKLMKAANAEIKKSVVASMQRTAKALYAELREAPIVEVLEGLRDCHMLHLIKGLGAHGKIYEEIPMEDDGSGRYHPECEALLPTIEEHGLNPNQPRGVQPLTGVFMKGMWLPDWRCVDANGKPTIWASWMQVKGVHKGLAKRRAKEGKVSPRNLHIGLLRVWDRRRFMSTGFEILENLGPLEGPDMDHVKARAINARIKAILKELIDEAMTNLMKDGLKGLLQKISKKDDVLQTIIQLLGRAQEMKVDIHPMDIDRVRKAMAAQLQRMLWKIATGGGIVGRQQVVVIDASLEPGECVTAHFAEGKMLATWRFPCVLAQGLKTLKVVEPRPHMMWKGKIFKELIWMNPADVLDIQGDDDGDFVACTDDPRVVELFSYRTDSRRYAIEPDGVNLPHLTESEEGYKYLAGTPMGPVGPMTIARSRLLAVGDYYGALACSVLIQEAVDKAKRSVRWTDWEKASNLANWREIDGVFYPHWWKLADGTHVPFKRYSEENAPAGAVRSRNFLNDREETTVTLFVMGGNKEFDLTSDELAVEVVRAWVKQRLARFGCRTGKPHYENPLGWKVQAGEVEKWNGLATIEEIEKRIDARHWQLCEEKQGGYEGGNFVHVAHDLAYYAWQQVKESQLGEVANQTREAVPLTELLPRMLEAQGCEVKETTSTWPEYVKGARTQAGIIEFAKAMQESISTAAGDSDDEVSDANGIAAAYGILHQRAQECFETDGIQPLVDVWRMETGDWYRYKDNQYTRFCQLNELPEGVKSSKLSNPNHAVHTICWPGSPILELLDITQENTCGFLSSKRMEIVLRRVFKHENAFQAVTDIVWNKPPLREDGTQPPTPHELATGIPVWECPDCLEKIKVAVVRKFRGERKRAEKRYLGTLIGQINAEGRDYATGGQAYLQSNQTDFTGMSKEDLRERLEELGSLDNRTREEEIELGQIANML